MHERVGSCSAVWDHAIVGSSGFFGNCDAWVRDWVSRKSEINFIQFWCAGLTKSICNSLLSTVLGYHTVNSGLKGRNLVDIQDQCWVIIVCLQPEFAGTPTHSGKCFRKQTVFFDHEINGFLSNLPTTNPFVYLRFGYKTLLNQMLLGISDHKPLEVGTLRP